MDLSGEQLKQSRIKVIELKEENQRVIEENEIYRKFFVLNMAYTKHNGIKEVPIYALREMNQVYEDFDLAIKNSSSFIEHGIDDIEKCLNNTVNENLANC